jgi:hypothetical protein
VAEQFLQTIQVWIDQESQSIDFLIEPGFFLLVQIQPVGACLPAVQFILSKVDFAAGSVRWWFRPPND